eukprot:6207999-Alexandrium_andersonii.AAC.1
MLAVSLDLRGATSRRLLAGPPLRLRTPCRTRGRGPAGARAGVTPSTARALSRNTVRTYACGPT